MKNYELFLKLKVTPLNVSLYPKTKMPQKKAGVVVSIIWPGLEAGVFFFFDGDPAWAEPTDVVGELSNHYESPQ